METGHVAQAIEQHYRPQGVRRGVLMSVGCPAAERKAAAAQMRSRGMDPDRWLATLHPRADRHGVTPREWEEFLERYGHEYVVAVLDSSVPETVVASARSAGCRVVRSGEGA